MSGLLVWIVLSVGCQNTIERWHFYFQRLLVVFVPSNFFHVADRSFYTNTSGCTDLIYHADLDILWVLVWDIRITRTSKGFTMERLIFPSLFQFINSFSFCLCLNLFSFFSRCRIFRNVVSAKVNLIYYCYYYYYYYIIIIIVTIVITIIKQILVFFVFCS